MKTIIAYVHRQLLNWCPPIVANFIRSLKSFYKNTFTPGCDNRILFTGDYVSWDEASKASVGYDSELILKRVLDATLKVKNGLAAYERDSVTFEEMEYSWPLLTNLMYFAARNGGELNVVDFGGSLGSSYFQSRPYLNGLSRVRWSVVEQSHFVEIGNRRVADEQLQFFNTAKEASSRAPQQVLLLSGVLQCIPDPYSTLRELLGYPWQQIIVDRTAFILSRDSDRLTVQTVPPSIYAASYPSWFLSRGRILEFFSSDYEVFTAWKCDEHHSPAGETTSYEGFCFTRKSR
jgi:putative methyltransferase (TIGR04325 family)